MAPICNSTTTTSEERNAYHLNIATLCSRGQTCFHYCGASISMEKSKRKFPFSSRFSALVCASVSLTLVLLLSIQHMPKSFQHHPITVRSAAGLRVNLREKDIVSLVQTHLEMCRGTLSKRQLGFIQDHTDALRTFIPDTFSDSFTNPCWYASIVVPPETILQQIISTTLTELMNTSVDEVSKLLVKTTSSGKERSHGNHKDDKLVCLPAFYLAGFSKCGTTTLYNLITAHPRIASPSIKEGHFWKYFMMNDEQYMYQALKSYYYLFHFDEAAKRIKKNPQTLTLDASPSTICTIKHGPLLVDSDTCMFPRIISAVLPNAKYIVIMRNPSTRLWSDYWFYCAIKNWKTENEEVKVPREYLKHGPDMFHRHSVTAIAKYKSCLQDKSEFECARLATMVMQPGEGCGARIGVGLYYLHIVKWLSVLPRKQFLFLRTEDLADDSQAVMKRVWKFLGLSPFVQNTPEVRHKTWREISGEHNTTLKMFPQTQKMLSSFYEPYNHILAALLKDDDFLWKD